MGSVLFELELKKKQKKGIMHYNRAFFHNSIKGRLVCMSETMELRAGIVLYLVEIKNPR